MELTDARDVAQNRPYWEMLAEHGATLSCKHILIIDCHHFS